MELTRIISISFCSAESATYKVRAGKGIALKRILKADKRLFVVHPDADAALVEQFDHTARDDQPKVKMALRQLLRFKRTDAALAEQKARDLRVGAGGEGLAKRPERMPRGYQPLGQRLKLYLADEPRRLFCSRPSVSKTNDGAAGRGTSKVMVFVMD